MTQLTLSDNPNVVTLPLQDEPPGAFVNQWCLDKENTVTSPLRYRIQTVHDHQAMPIRQNPHCRREDPISSSHDRGALGPQNSDVNTLNDEPSMEFRNFTVAHFDPSAEPLASESPDVGNPTPAEPAEEGRNEQPTTAISPTSGGGRTIVRVPRSQIFLGYPGIERPQGPMSFHLLLDRFNMSRFLFPVQMSEETFNFWSSVNTLYVNVSRKLAWNEPAFIESDLVIRQLFGTSKSIMIPLRDRRRVDFAWDVLTLSDEPEMTRVRDELERAASAVHGPDGMRDLPFHYREPTSPSWEMAKIRYMWHWLYMRYLGQPWCIPFENIWERFNVNGARVSVPKYSWVPEELRKMPKIEEVLFISLPGFVPPPGACRMTPPLMVLDHRNMHISFSAAPSLIQGSDWDTYLEVPPTAMANTDIDYSQYPMVTQMM